MADKTLPAGGAAAVYLRQALRALGRGELLVVRAQISDALRLLEADTHTPVNPCPKCSSSTTYLAGGDFMCVTCGHCWNPFTQAVDNGLVANDARPGGASPDQLRSLDAAFAMLGISDTASRRMMASVSAGRQVETLAELSYTEAGNLAENLIKRASNRETGS